MNVMDNGDACSKSISAENQATIKTKKNVIRRRSAPINVATSGGGICSNSSCRRPTVDSNGGVQLYDSDSEANGKKKALKRRCQDVGQSWRKKLSACRSPSVGSNMSSLREAECGICTSFRRSSSSNEIQSNSVVARGLQGNSPNATINNVDEFRQNSNLSGDNMRINRPPTASLLNALMSSGSRTANVGGYSSMLLNSAPPNYGRETIALENRHSGANSTIRSSNSSAIVRRTLSVLANEQRLSHNAIGGGAGVNNSAPSSRRLAIQLFPCFKRQRSSDSESESDGKVSHRHQRPTSNRMAVQALSRELSSRLCLGDSMAVNRSISIGSSSASRFIAAPYPVHTQVEYTHYLVPDLLEITNASYYWGVMDRFQAEKLLEGKPEGTFLLRDSAQTEYLFSVSFRRYGRSLHARIEQLNHRFSFDSHDEGVFNSESVTGLIDHYKNPAVCLFFEPQLSLPLKRNFVFPLQHLCRSVITSHLTSYDGVQELNLPKSMKEYLEEYHYKQAVRVKRLEH